MVLGCSLETKFPASRLRSNLARFCLPSRLVSFLLWTPTRMARWPPPALGGEGAGRSRIFSKSSRGICLSWYLRMERRPRMASSTFIRIPPSSTPGPGHTCGRDTLPPRRDIPGRTGAARTWSTSRTFRTPGTGQASAR